MASLSCPEPEGYGKKRCMAWSTANGSNPKSFSISRAAKTQAWWKYRNPKTSAIPNKIPVASLRVFVLSYGVSRCTVPSTISGSIIRTATQKRGIPRTIMVGIPIRTPASSPVHRAQMGNGLPRKWKERPGIAWQPHKIRRNCPNFPPIAVCSEKPFTGFFCLGAICNGCCTANDYEYGNIDQYAKDYAYKRADPCCLCCLRLLVFPD